MLKEALKAEGKCYQMEVSLNKTTTMPYRIYNSHKDEMHSDNSTRLGEKKSNCHTIT